MLENRPAWKGSQWVPERAAPAATCTAYQRTREEDGAIVVPRRVLNVRVTEWREDGA